MRNQMSARGRALAVVVVVAMVGCGEAFDPPSLLKDLRVLAIEAQGRVGIMLNVRTSDLAAVLGLLPALQQPTISPLSDASWVALNTIIEERTVRDLIPKLKAARAQGIVEYPLNKIVI
jgi:ATP phosphoribosyltransferase-like protein